MSSSYSLTRTGAAGVVLVFVALTGPIFYQALVTNAAVRADEDRRNRDWHQEQVNRLVDLRQSMEDGRDPRAAAEARRLEAQINRERLENLNAGT